MERLLIRIERTVVGWEVLDAGGIPHSCNLQQRALDAAESMALGHHFKTGRPVGVVMQMGAADSVLLSRHG